MKESMNRKHFEACAIILVVSLIGMFCLSFVNVVKMFSDIFG